MQNSLCKVLARGSLSNGQDLFVNGLSGSAIAQRGVVHNFGS